MNQPTITAKQPTVLELEPGTYYYCTCGNTKNGAFCDGSHQGTGFAPMQFTLKGKQKVALCLCKHTKDFPYYDGTHSKL